MLSETDSIPMNGTPDQYAFSACRYSAIRETVNELLEWMPEEVEDEEV